MFELGDQQPRQETSATPRRTILRAAGFLGLTGAGAAALGACADALQRLATCYAGRGRNLCASVAIADCGPDIFHAVSVDGEGPRGSKCRRIQGAGRRRRDLGEGRLRGNPTEQGKVQGLQQDLHSPGMSGGIRRQRGHSLQLPRQRVLNRGWLGDQPAGHQGSCRGQRPPSSRRRSTSPADLALTLSHFASVHVVLASPADSAASK